MITTNFSQLRVSDTQIKKWLFNAFGITVQKIKALQGESDFNYYIQSESGQEYTFKVSRPNTNVEELDFQASIMQHLQSKELPLDLPMPLATLDGLFYKKVADEHGQNRYIRLQNWVSGRVVDSVQPRTNTLLQSWGETVGHLSKGLKGFDHSAAHRFYKWNPCETLYSKKYETHFQTEEQQETAQYFWNYFEKNTLPKLPNLRKSVNYADAHELNLIANQDLQSPKIIGVIDFGDALYMPTICEIAIACAYAGMSFPDPLMAMAQVIKGYHSVFPLEEQELEVLFSLITARLMITVANAAYNKHIEPDNEYLQISERPAWDILKKLRRLSPTLAHYTFRNACEMSPHPKQKHFEEWAATVDFASVVDFQNKKITTFDLSVESLDLGNNANFETTASFQKTVNRLLEDKNADIGIGGYGEVRPLYTTDAYQVIANQGTQWRTVHLGLDIWDVAQTPVFAPLDGIVHSFKNNNKNKDYGATIILEHQISDDFVFYTLYGHLSLASLTGLQKGQIIQKGQQIATFGNPSENGNWAPHLHFQIMLDMLSNEGDFAGVAYPTERDTWLSICPNPAFLLPKTYQKFQSSTTLFTTNHILHLRKKHLGRSLSLSYKEPLHMVRGYKQYLYDITGRRYLDTVNNVAHVGHEHPRVVKAAQRQTSVLNTNTRYLHQNLVEYAEKLAATFPPELSVVHFVNSGSEANELALRMAKAYSNQQDMIAVEVGYHGNTNQVIDISSYKFDGKGGKGAPQTTQVVPMPDTFRGEFKNPATAGAQYAKSVQRAIDYIQGQGRGVAGFICESILSCGGQVMLPNNYLKEAFRYVRQAGGVCIMDEVQVGFGRVGKHFWGFELQDVVPDIVTLGKPIGNGHPLGAVVCTPAVADAFANGMEYFNTFGGNPVSCAIGLEVLNVIKDEGLQDNVLKVGNYLMKELKGFQQRFPIIGDVRGSGLFLGFELIKNLKTLEPAAAQTAYLANRMRELGVLMSTDGLYHNVIKLKPPICFGQKDADLLLMLLDEVFREDFMKG